MRGKGPNQVGSESAVFLGTAFVSPGAFHSFRISLMILLILSMWWERGSFERPYLLTRHQCLRPVLIKSQLFCRSIRTERAYLLDELTRGDGLWRF